jgi:hypothetical protein
MLSDPKILTAITQALQKGPAAFSSATITIH